jgi:hypothetical protein
MLVLINTVTLAHYDFVVSARFYHAMSPVPSEQRIQLALLGKRFAVTFRRRHRSQRDTGDTRLVYYHKRPRRLRCRGGWTAIIV